MKWQNYILSFVVLLLIGGAANAQSARSYHSSTSITSYVFIAPYQPVVTRGIAAGPNMPFMPSGVKTSANGGSGYTHRLAGTEIQLMNMSFVAKAQSLPPKLYKTFSTAANSMRKDTARSAILRRLIYELPSKMVGTTYVPPSPEAIMKTLVKVETMTDAQVAAYWRNR